jgi:hypothetical protein
MQKHEFVLKVKQMKIKVSQVTTLLSFNHHAFAQIASVQEPSNLTISVYLESCHLHDFNYSIDEVRLGLTYSHHIIEKISINLGLVKANLNTDNGTGQFNVEFFFCKCKRLTSEPIVRASLSSQSKTNLNRWRLRPLSESINQQPRYGIRNSQVRFTPPEERGVAEALANALKSKGVGLEY